jgi:hypothetical protein
MERIHNKKINWLISRDWPSRSEIFYLATGGFITKPTLTGGLKRPFSVSFLKYILTLGPELSRFCDCRLHSICCSAVIEVMWGVAEIRKIKGEQ